MTYFIYKEHPQKRHPGAGFEVNLGRGKNAMGEQWYLGRCDDALVSGLAGWEHKVIGTDPDADIEAAAPWLRDNRASKIRNEGSRRLTDLAGPYLPEERETWFVQREEAQAVLADPAAATPMLSALATARGVTVDVLAGLVMENVSAYQAASGTILGTQQALLNTIYNQTTPLATVLATEWPA